MCERKCSRVSHRPPAVLRIRILSALLFCFLTLIIGLGILQRLSSNSKLYQKAILYQVSFSIYQRKITTIAPYSIIPTVIAVMVGFWWDSLDQHLRLLQPYISMSKLPRTIQNGAGLSYEMSYWLWAGVKAAKHKDWVLCTATIGTTLSQICKSQLRRCSKAF